ncbi:MAG: beta-lactamase family protein [Bacteroidetes bacterium]|nr:beta-lactamase family protein [Bacteroidota bacterium]
MKSIFVFLASFLLLFSSCNNSNNNSVSETVSPPPSNNDSINKFLKVYSNKKTKQLDALFKNKVKTARFNGCVLVAQHGKIIYKNVWGLADFKTKKPLTINSSFQLASASKTLTASAILLLKDQEKLKLTDGIQQYLPNFPYQGITIEMLLTHRSGLSNYVYFCEPYCDELNCYNGSVFDNNALMHIIELYKPSIYFKPNRKFEYCNTNYALLALIIEKISGLSFADFMDKNFFKPLGMNDTWVHNYKSTITRENKTLGHDASGRLDKEIYADDVVGDKGIYSTVEDMFKWDQALYTQKILKKETIEEAFTGYSNEHKGKRNYGYGWRLIDNGKNNKIVYHNGWWHGYNTLFYRRPLDQTTVIILTNKDNRTIYHIEDVLAILDNGLSAPEIETEE